MGDGNRTYVCSLGIYAAASIRPLSTKRHLFCTLSSKLVESADVTKGSRLQKVRVMFSGLGSFSRVAFYQPQCCFFETKGISEGEYKSELVLPCVALELGHGDLVGQRPPRVGRFTWVVVVDAVCAKRGVWWQRPLYSLASTRASNGTRCHKNVILMVVNGGKMPANGD